MTRYRTVLADPPWPEHGGGQIKRGADRHYPLMSITEIMELRERLVRLVDLHGCHLYLWVTNNYLQEGLKVMNCWGFEYITMVTWFKDKAGLGQYFRGRTEHCLFGKAGHLPFKECGGKRQQGETGFIELPSFHAKRGKHSVKPRQMRKMIEKVSPGPYLELFAREPAKGWDGWGHEFGDDFNAFGKQLDLLGTETE